MKKMEKETIKPESSEGLPSPERLPAEVEKTKFWENPSFLFVAMGVLTMTAMIGTYFVAQKYNDPIIVIGSVSLVAGITILIGGMAIKAMEQLSAANRMKTEFVSIASHQLRTPLSIIKWYVEFLAQKNKQANLTPEQINYLKIISDSNQRMIRLVNDLLDISRIEGKRIQIHPEKVSLVELSKNIIQENQPLADKKNIKVSIKSDDNIPLLFVDPKRISMVVENLFSNAVKYIKEENGGTISVEIFREDSKIIFSIADNGVGIPDKDKKKIFKKFFRAENTMKLQTSGTGLGLFIAKAIIESHKGTMWFVSKEGEGTTFYFKLPIKSRGFEE
ncbi:HAMP domain-containing histidine kinase [Candidatus Kuenenbacteria bacterium]|nr:HAMP domain-containing histidine kinase [Candidatus Kuenenbacteria bacterium]